MMKKRRFLALTLAATLTVSLAVPAFAAEEVPGIDTGYVSVSVAEPVKDSIDPVLEPAPGAEGRTPVLAANSLVAEGPSEYELFVDAFLTEYTATHSEEYANFDADAAFAENYGDDWWTVEEYLEYFGEEGETLKDAMWREYVEGLARTAWYAKKVEEYRANHPGDLESLEIAELLTRRGYGDPMEEFMDYYGYTTEEEARINLYYGYVRDREWAADTHEIAEEYRAEYPELWAAFDDGAYFAENYSHYTVGKFMQRRGLWTYDEFVDELFVEYVEDQMFGNGRDLELTLSVNGETLWDSSLYVENGVSYLPADELNAILGTHYTEATPIREAAMAKGWDVFWNPNYNEIVLLNKAEITADWDFTNFDAMMNRLLKGLEYKEGKPFHTRETADITLTQFNTLDGDETYTFKVTADTVLQDNVLNLTLTADLAQILQMLPQTTLNQIEYQLPKVTFQNLKTMLSDCKVQMILNLEEGTAYVNAPILSLLDESLTSQTWFALDLGDAYSAESMETLQNMLAGEWNTADYLYAALLSDSATTYYGADLSYQNAKLAGALLKALLGNEAVTEKDGTYTWQVDLATLDKMTRSAMIDMVKEFSEEELSEDELEEYLPSVSAIFKECNVTVTVDENGKFTASATLRLDMDGIVSALVDMYGPIVLWELGGLLDIPDFRLTGESQGTAQHATGTTELHVKNQFKLVVQEVTDVVKDTPTVRTAPPAGAEIVEW